MLGHGAYARDITEFIEYSASSSVAAAAQEKPKLTTITEPNPTIQSMPHAPFPGHAKKPNADSQGFVRCSKVLLREKTDSFSLQDIEMFAVVASPSASGAS